MFVCSICHFNKTNLGNLKKIAILSGKFAAKITLYIGSTVDLILKSLAKRNDLLENIATFQTNPIFFSIFYLRKTLSDLCEVQLKFKLNPQIKSKDKVFVMQFLHEKLGPNSRNLSSFKIRQGEEGNTSSTK